MKKEKDVKSSTKKVAGKIWPDCSAVGPNLGDYSPRVRQRAPVEKENEELLRLFDKSAARWSSSRTLELKEAA